MTWTALVESRSGLERIDPAAPHWQPYLLPPTTARPVICLDGVRFTFDDPVIAPQPVFVPLAR